MDYVGLDFNYEKLVINNHFNINCVMTFIITLI